MAYVDGFVLPVPIAELDAYVTAAKEMAVIWKEFGALSVIESRADDVPYGKLTSFPRAVLAKDDEVVIFSLVTFRDRTHRDAVNAAVMADPRMGAIMKNSSIDGKRMIWGGFEIVVAA